MDIYVLRHAIAGNRRPGLAEAKRQLTAPGIAKLHHVLNVARAAGVKPSLILTSPYVRAARTAEIAAGALRSKSKPVETEVLLPDASPQAVWDEIRKHRRERAVMLVGHEPMLSATASYLLGASWTMMNLRKSALVRITIAGFGARPHGILEWLLTPKLAAK